VVITHERCNAQIRCNSGVDGYSPELKKVFLFQCCPEANPVSGL
jgi:hypothetical protein